MGYLLLAILCSAMISIMMRLSTNKTAGRFSVLAGNYLVCALLAAAYGGFRVVLPEVPGFSVTVWLGIISGVLYLAGLIALQVNTANRGVVLSSVFMKLGLLVPMAVSVVLFRELPTAGQLVGFALAVFAIILINWKKEAEGKGFGFGLLLLLLLNGGAEVMAKIFDVYGAPTLSSQYLFYTFGTALVLCLVPVIYKKERPGFRELLYGILIGVPNFFAAKFLLGALDTLPAVVAYPSFSVAAMLLVTLTGVVVFKERLRKLQWIALAGIVIALVLLNI